MKRYLLRYFFLGTAISCPGCITIYHSIYPDENRNVIHVTSNPPGATVYVDGVERGTTPTNVSIERKRRPTYVTVEGDTASETFHVKRRLNPWYFANIIYVIYGFPVDYFTGAYKRISQTFYEIDLTKEKRKYNLRDNFYVITQTDTFYTQEKMHQLYGKLHFRLLTGEKRSVRLSKLRQFKVREFEASYGTIETRNTNVGNTIFEYRPFQPYLHKRKQKYVLMALILKQGGYSLLKGYHRQTSYFSEEYKFLDYYYVFRRDEFITKVTGENIAQVMGAYFNACGAYMQFLEVNKTEDVGKAIAKYFALCSKEE